MNTKNIVIVVLLIALIGLGAYSFFGQATVNRGLSYLARRVAPQPAALTAIVKSPFLYNFAVDGALHESGSMDGSSSPYWWLNSGGKFILSGGLGKTIQGELPASDRWRLAYSASNFVDTDNGYHPQNILRLITRSKWINFQQEIYFKMNKLNFSASENRNASNGVLLMSRYYMDGQTLYYTGIRVDGFAVIKKKINGTYFTLANKKVYSADAPYNRDTNPNLIPGQKWIGIRSVVMNNSDGSVSIKLFMDKDKTGNWVLVAEAIDNGKSFGGAAISGEGYAGLRTDFMDVEFDDYRIVANP